MAQLSLQGARELDRKLAELASPRERATALRASVRKPMRAVQKVARQNMASFSPGEAESHRTYLGRIVSAGFASRNTVVAVNLSRDKQTVTARLGVKNEAFYAAQFFELGTSKIPAQPWLRPAFDASRDKMISGVADVLKAHVEKLARRGGTGS